MSLFFSSLITFFLSVPALAQVDVTISPAGPSGGSTVGNGSGRVSQPTPYRPRPTSSRSSAGAFEDFCVSESPLGCNVMREETLKNWVDEERLSTQFEFSTRQQELAARESSLDRDLAALRSGGSMNGSGFGAAIQAKVNAASASKLRSVALAANRERVLADASAANHAAIDRAVAAAEVAVAKPELASSLASIDKSIGRYYISERLDHEYIRADSIESRIRTEGGQYERDRLMLASDGRYALDSARRSLELGLLERSQYALKLGARLLDVAIDFSPLLIVAAAPQATVAIGVAMAVSFAKDYYEARTGRRLLGGEALTVTERSAAMLGAVLAVAPVVGPSYKALAAASEGLAIFADVAKTAKVEARAGSAAVAELASLDDAVRGAGEVLDSAKKFGVPKERLSDFVDSVRLFGQSADEVGEAAATLTNKMDFVFGKATGSAHNIERSQDMLRQMERIGLPDSPTSRTLVKENLIGTLKDPNSVAEQLEGGRVLRDSLLSGPGGHLKIESIWDGVKLITVKLKGG